MSDIALHLDSTRARAACLGPSGVMVPVLDSMGQVAMPMVGLPSSVLKVS